MTDWQAIKTEYITTAVSYRELAQKYGMSVSQVEKTGRREGWVALRSQHLADALQQALEADKQQRLCRAQRFQSMVDTLQDKVAASVEALEPSGSNPRDIRALCATVKELQELLGLKAEKDDISAVEVVFAAGPEEWNE